ncbi:g6704 [Coccomyxa elongata]
MAVGQRAEQGPRVCILGGGFGGLYTALRLDSLLWPHGSKPQVTLIDRSERFVFKPLLYELLNGGATEDEVAPPFSQLLAPYSINFIQGSVSAVELEGAENSGDNAGGRVVLANGSAVEYDWLVLALGSDSVFFGIEGVRELCLPFNTYSDAMRADRQLRLLEQRPGPSNVIVVGGGYCGIELATTVAERMGGRGRLQLVTGGGDILEGSPLGQREAARRTLQDQGVDIITNAFVTRVEASEQPATAAEASSSDSGRRVVHLKLPGEQSQVLEADMVLWTAGSGPVSKEGVGEGGLKLPFPANDRGAVRTDATLRVVDHPRVFALGDVSSCDASGEASTSAPSLAPTAQVAFQQADYVAWNLWASINGRPLLPFKYQHLGEMMSLGRARGAVTLPLPLAPPLRQALDGGLLGSLLSVAGIKVGSNDDGQGVTLEGPLAGAMRRAAYLYRQPTAEQRLAVGASWLQQAAAEGATLAQRALSGRPPWNR